MIQIATVIKNLQMTQIYKVTRLSEFIEKKKSEDEHASKFSTNAPLKKGK